MFKKLIGIMKINNSLNNPKRRKRRLALSYSKKIISIITRNNFKP